MKKSLARNIVVLIFLFTPLVMTGCAAPKLPHNHSYNGAAIDGLVGAGKSVDVSAELVPSAGIPTESTEYRESLVDAVSDALQKSGFAVASGVGAESMALHVALSAVDDQPLWSYDALTGKNIGVAAIPLAGAFMDRYYVVSTSFKAQFIMKEGDRVVLDKAFTMGDKKEVAVSNSKRVIESRDAAFALYEEQRDLAIQQFLDALCGK